MNKILPIILVVVLSGCSSQPPPPNVSEQMFFRCGDTPFVVDIRNQEIAYYSSRGIIRFFSDKKQRSGAITAYSYTWDKETERLNYQLNLYLKNGVAAVWNQNIKGDFIYLKLHEKDKGYGFQCERTKRKDFEGFVNDFMKSLDSEEKL